MPMIFHNPIRFTPKGTPEGIVMRMNPPGRKTRKMAKKTKTAKRHAAKARPKTAKRHRSKGSRPKTRRPAASKHKTASRRTAPASTQITKALQNFGKKLSGLSQGQSKLQEKVERLARKRSTGGSIMAKKRKKGRKATSAKPKTTTKRKKGKRRSATGASAASVTKALRAVTARLAKASKGIQPAAQAKARRKKPRASNIKAGPRVVERFAQAGFSSNPTRRRKSTGRRTAAQKRATAKMLAGLKRYRRQQKGNPILKNRPVAYSWRPKGSLAKPGSGNRTRGGFSMARSPYPQAGRVNPVFGLNQGNIEMKTLAVDAAAGVAGTIVAGIAQRFVVKDFVRATVNGQTVVRRNPWAVIWHGLIGIGGGLALRQWGKNPTLKRVGTATAYTTLTYLLTRTGHDLTTKVGFLNPSKTLSDLPIVNRIPLVFGTAANKAAAVTAQEAGALLAGVVTDADKERLLGGAVTSEEADRLLGGVVSEDEKNRLLGAYNDGIPGPGDYHAGW